VGYLIAFSRAVSRSFSEEDARTLAEIASRAGPAIDGALLATEAEALRDVDALTGLANRLAFDGALAREVGLATRTRARLALVLLDLDDFRAVNLRRGHEVGDDVLRDTAERIRTAVGPGDVLARIGGDEFAVILPGSTLDAAERLCARLQAEVAPKSGANGLAVSFSAGIAELGADEDAGALLRRADQALYHAQAGRGQVAVSDVTPRVRTR
jgi:diguanylate cyclase (GGDEF)-like protein